MRSEPLALLAGLGLALQPLAAGEAHAGVLRLAVCGGGAPVDLPLGGGEGSRRQADPGCHAACLRRSPLDCDEE